MLLKPFAAIFVGFDNSQTRTHQGLRVFFRPKLYDSDGVGKVLVILMMMMMMMLMMMMVVVMVVVMVVEMVVEMVVMMVMLVMVMVVVVLVVVVRLCETDILLLCEAVRL